MGRLIDTDDLMESVCKEYDRKYEEAGHYGLKLAWIEKAVSDTPTYQTESGWVDVDERLPEDDGFVLAWIETGHTDNINFYRCIEIATYDANEGWMLEHYPEADVTITHWMDPADPLGRPRATIESVNASGMEG